MWRQIHLPLVSGVGDPCTLLTGLGWSWGWRARVSAQHGPQRPKPAWGIRFMLAISSISKCHHSLTQSKGEGPCLLNRPNCRVTKGKAPGNGHQRAAAATQPREPLGLALPLSDMGQAGHTALYPQVCHSTKKPSLEGSSLRLTGPRGVTHSGTPNNIVVGCMASSLFSH